MHAREESCRPGPPFADAPNADPYQPGKHPTANGTECFLMDGTDICHPPEATSPVSAPLRQRVVGLSDFTAESVSSEGAVFKYILILSSSAALSLVATRVVRRIAINFGAVDVLGGRRIHSAPTPRFGGLAVFLSIILALAVACLTDSFVAGTLLAHSAEVAGLFAATTVLMVVGLVDDRHSLRPVLKLAGQILAGIIAVAAGCRIDTVVRIDLGWLGPPATVFWIVAIINAVNMVDGVDGLAAGIGPNY
jgi:hypothetical protein